MDTQNPVPETLPLFPTKDPSPSIFPLIFTALVFFVLGILVSFLLFSGEDSQAPSDLQAAVDGTFMALTPTATPEPTRVPEELTYKESNPWMGAENAPVVMVEFSDYLCPYCDRFHTETLGGLMTHYDGLLKFVYRDHPIIGGSTTANIGAAAQCANQQGKYWEFTDLIWANEDRRNIDETILTDYATQVELDLTAYNTCITDQTGYNLVVADFEDASNFNITGTPGFFINGTRFTFGAVAIEYFMDVIDAELVAKGITPPERPDPTDSDTQSTES